MYGYIRTHAPELRLREQEEYRALYCGLCRTLGKCTGQCSRMTLSYDFTYFAAVRMALEGKTPTHRTRRCPVHPLHKRLMAETDDVLSFCAYASGILSYHKLKDDRRDEHGRKRVRAVLLSPYTRFLRRRALKRGYADLDARVGVCMDALTALEAEKPASVDQPAEMFGALMADLLAWGLDGETEILARTIGRHIGRWVFIMDAADDLKEDVRRGRYNPLVCLWGDGDMTDRRREELRVALICELQGVERALDLVELEGEEKKNLAGIIRNVLYLGMPSAAGRVLDGECSGACAEKSRIKKKNREK